MPQYLGGAQNDRLASTFRRGPGSRQGVHQRVVDTNNNTGGLGADPNGGRGDNQGVRKNLGGGRNNGSAAGILLNQFTGPQLEAMRAFDNGSNIIGNCIQCGGPHRYNNCCFAPAWENGCPVKRVKTMSKNRNKPCIFENFTDDQIWALDQQNNLTTRRVREKPSREVVGVFTEVKNTTPIEPVYLDLAEKLGSGRPNLDARKYVRTKHKATQEEEEEIQEKVHYVPDSMDRAFGGVSYAMAAEDIHPIEPTYLALVNKLKSEASKSGLTAHECAAQECSPKHTKRCAGRNCFADATARISEQCNVEYVLRAGSKEMVKLQDWLLDTASTIHITRNSAILKYINTVSRGGIQITSAGGEQRSPPSVATTPTGTNGSEFTPLLTAHRSTSYRLAYWLTKRRRRATACWNTSLTQTLSASPSLATSPSCTSLSASEVDSTSIATMNLSMSQHNSPSCPRLPETRHVSPLANNKEQTLPSEPKSNLVSYPRKTLTQQCKRTRSIICLSPLLTSLMLQKSTVLELSPKLSRRRDDGSFCQQ